MKQFEARIRSNRAVAPLWRELVLSWEAERPLPGQFLTLRASPRYDPLLRRPFAFAGFSEGAEGGPPSASLLYQVRGQATALLADLAAGAWVDVLGPLGRPFPPSAPGERPLLVAGGIGLGPVLFLARELEAADARPLLVLGFRDAAAIPDIELPPGAVVCTDDGSAGERGFPSEWIARNVSPDGRARIYGCGPGPLLASLASLAAARSWASSLSAEQWMACGVGACAGCALPKADGSGFLRACAEGPVFEGSEIDWKGSAR
ncbi:MAG TPA: dihydroorotate dehydrogenase electron transfer subunit [Spirochaetales bacterium]|nr:dihydroorotate dehydrogenase electron transfer subunit [Spirochaetales bacterium]HRY53603.1 dihydroorotate dehydrogenase electron transfer subunit [Spirochaetia bacterium]